MEIRGRDLGKYATKVAPLPEPVKPTVSLAEEVVLLSLGQPHGRVRRAAGMVSEPDHRRPRSFGEAVKALKRRHLIERDGLSGLRATPAAHLAAREQRLSAIIARPAAPEDADAELLVLVAMTGALGALHATVVRSARMRIASIGEGGSRLPPAVEIAAADLGCDTMAELADRVLPLDRHFESGAFDPGMTPGIGSSLY
jgi:hypothetical protein